MVFGFLSQGFFPAPGKTPRPGAHYHTVLVGLMHPASRGTVHITSPDPADKPSVDPAYLSNSVDRDLLVHGVRFVKKMQDTEPLKALTEAYVEPAWDEEDEEEGGVSENELREFVKNGLEPIYHPVRFRLPMLGFWKPIERFILTCLRLELLPCCRAKTVEW